MIPCKECLVLAICRTKETVECSLLNKWIAKSTFSHKEAEGCFPNFMFFAICISEKSDEIRIGRRKTDDSM